MQNRAKIINFTLVAGTISVLVMSFSFVNFFCVLWASPQLVAKIRFLQFGMTVSGSIATFLNAFCIFILCVNMKYAIEHYVRRIQI